MRRIREITSAVTSLFIGVVLLYCFQFTTLERFSSHAGEDRLNSSDLILIGLIIIFLFIIPFFCEIKKGAISKLCEFIFSSETITILFLLFFCFVMLRFYLSPGYLYSGGDAYVHVPRCFIFFESLKKGEYPIWSNYYYCGYPFLQFYGPLFYLLTSLVTIFLKNTHLAIKVTLLIFHILSSYTLYLLVSLITECRRSAFFSAVVYSLSFWHLIQILQIGRLPVALIYTILPLPFFIFEQYLKKNSIFSLFPIFLISSLSLLIMTHYGYAYFTFIIFMLFAILRIVLLQKTWQQKVKNISFVMTCVLCAFISTSYFTLPQLLEGEMVNLFRNKWFLYKFSIPSIWQLLAWSNYRFSLLPKEFITGYGGYVGIVPFIIAIYALYRTMKDFKKEYLPYSFLFLLTAFLVFGYKSSMLKIFPLVYYFNSERFLTFFVFPFSVLSGIGLSCFINKYSTIRIAVHGSSNNNCNRLFIILFTLLLMDLGLTSFQDTFDDHTLKGRKEVYHWLKSNAHRFPNYRILDLSSFDDKGAWYDLLNYYPGIASVEAGMATPMGIYEQGRPNLLFDTSVFAKILCRDFIGRGTFSVYELDLLCLLNVKYLIGSNFKNIPPLAQIKRFAGGIIMAECKDYSPIAVAKKIEVYHGGRDSEKDLKGIIEKMKVDRDKKVADVILVQGEKGIENMLIESGGKVNVTVLNHQVDNQMVDLCVKVNTPCFAQLGYSYYPYLEIMVNGKKAESLPSAIGFIVISLPEGINQIIIKPYLSPLRKYLFIFCCGFWLLIITVQVVIARSCRHLK